MSAPSRTSTADPVTTTRTVDVAIVGGGIAGLWLANLLTARGYGNILLETGALGGEQTLASQGLIHGGLKYALSGNLTGASEAIAGMPGRWRRCLAGQGEVDLRGVSPLSDRYYLFAGDSALGKLTTFFASRALRGRISRLDPAEHPAALADPGFRGVVYALDDFVLDVRGLVQELARCAAGRVYRHRLHTASLAGAADGIVIELGEQRLLARRLLLAAGTGNGTLLTGLGIDSPRMQRRPLQQVLVRHRYPHPLFAHCLTGIRRPEPRLTITSHRQQDGWVWYLGGQLATDGAELAPEALVRHARDELAECLPWIDWRSAELSTLRVDRAEPFQQGGRRPDQAFAEAHGHCIVTWPTKLSLVPDLGDRVLALLPPPECGAAPALPLPAASAGRPPWDR